MFGFFEKILCIGLERNTGRRNHSEGEFARLGVPGFIWVNAIDKHHPEVAAAFQTGLVKKYPPCFRCGEDACDCDNKKLMPEQVGNWFSHLSAWKRVTGEGLTMICEDDVKFTDRAFEAMSFIANSDQIAEPLRRGQPVLVRIGMALCESHYSDSSFHLTDKCTMSNPCYAINRAMARLLTASMTEIGTTSDIYIHRIVGPKASHFTLEPPAAYELSWSTGELRSDIRPKAVFIERLEIHLSSLDPNDPEYREVQKTIESEKDRMRELSLFNEPSGT